MSYLPGALLLGLTLGAVGWAALLTVRLRLPAVMGAARLAALGLLACAGVVAVHVVPAAFGVLGRWSVPLAAVLLLVAASRLPAANPLTDSPAPPPPPSSRLSWVLAAGASLVAAGWVLGLVVQEYPSPPLQVDMVTFHLPLVASWLETGSLWRVEDFVPDKAPGYYPANGDIPMLAVVLPWDKEFLAHVVNLPLLGLLGVALYATGVELGAARAHALLFAAAAVALPVVAVIAVLGLADTFLLATFATGVLFLVRHARLGRRSDLVLAGLGLGLAMGSKWYGVTALAAVLAAWGLASLLARETWRRVAVRGAALVGLAALAGGVWLVRNLVEAGNPVFPVEVAPLGTTLFDAPRDFEREVFGFTLADYIGDGEIWSQALLPGLRGTLSLTAVVLAAGGIAAVVIALRSRPAAGRPLAMVGAAVLVGIAYLLTPYSAQGVEGYPDAGANARYVVPALVLVAPATAWASTRLGGAALALQVAGLAGVIYGVAGTDVYYVPLDARSVAVAVAAVAAAVGGAFLLWRLQAVTRRRALAVAAATGMAAALLVGYLGYRAYDDRRYAGLEPAIDWILDNAPEDRRIGLAGLGYNPVIYPAFGPRLENEVDYVGPTVKGMLRPHTRPAPLLDDLREGRYDLMVVQREGWVRRDLPARQERWLRAGGWTVMAESERVALYAPRSAEGGDG